MEDVGELSRYEYFRLGKQFEGKCVIRKESGYCCMKVKKAVIYYNKNESSFIELYGYGYEVRNKNGFKC